MISRQIGAMLSLPSGPALAALRPSITCASRSGRNTTDPSCFFSSPTCWATSARRLSAPSNSRSIASMRSRNACSWELGAASAIGCFEFLHAARPPRRADASVWPCRTGWRRATVAAFGLFGVAVGIVLDDALQAGELGAIVECDQRHTLGGTAEFADLGHAGAHQHPAV